MKLKYVLILSVLLLVFAACAPKLTEDNNSDVTGVKESADSDLNETAVKDAAETAKDTDSIADDTEQAVNETDSMTETMTEETTSAVNEPEADVQKSVMQNETEEMLAENGEIVSGATLIAGKVSNYYEWNKELYDKSLAEGKSLFLFFASDTYSDSVKQEEYLEEAFPNLNIKRIVGFKLHFRDDLVTPEQDKLALEYGVGTIMTKVIVKNGSLVHKSTELWNTDKAVRQLSQTA